MIKGPMGSGKSALGARLLGMTTGGGTHVTSDSEPTLPDSFYIGHALDDRDRFSAVSLKSNDSLTSPGTIGLFQKSLGTEGAITVFDSWDSITHGLGDEEKQRVERVVVEMARAGKSRVAFIVEGTSTTSLDHESNSIVTLSQRRFGAGRLREIEWTKLPEDSLSSNSLFTIHKGVLEIIPTATPWSQLNGPYLVIPNTATHFMTGSTDLDAFFGGGLRRGSMVLLELGDNFSHDWQAPILTNIGINFLHNGGCSLILPAVTILPEDLLKVYQPFIAAGLLERSLRIFTHVHLMVGEVTVPLTGDNPQKDFDMMVEAYDLLRVWDEGKQMKVGQGEGTIKISGTKKERPCLISFDLSTWTAFHSIFDTSLPAKTIFRMKMGGDLIVVVAKSDSRSLHVFADVCDYHVKLEEIDDSVVLYSIKPKVHPHAVIFDDSQGRPEIRLYPIS